MKEVLFSLFISMSSLFGGVNSCVEQQVNSVIGEAQYQVQLQQQEVQSQIQQQIGINQMLQQQHDQWFIDESMRNVMPFEMGGYDMNQGNSFNQPTFNDFGGMNCGEMMF